MSSLISVIVNCHNGEKYLENCILSILGQKYTNFEIIFFDNSSSDRSKKILDQFKDDRIKYFYSKIKLPLYQARNEAVKKSSGFLIAFLDTDDWWDENYLLNKEKFFNNENYDYFYSNVMCFYEKKNKFIKYNQKKLPNGKIYNYLAKNYFVVISGLIIKKNLLEKENYFNSTYSIIGDYDLLMRISKYANAKSFDDPLVYYRIHENNFSKKNDKIYFDEYYDWFYSQKKRKDKLFQENIKYFQLRLSKLQITYLLFKKKNLMLFKQIVKYPILSHKIKFFLAFLLPTKLINFFRK